MKAQTEYAHKRFPSTSSIVDLVRCSVTFNSVAEMIRALADFEDKIDKHEAGCVIDVLRIKNGFQQILTWKTVCI